MLVLGVLSGPEGRVVRELAGAISIGLAGELGGAVLDGDQLWDPADRQWR